MCLCLFTHASEQGKVWLGVRIYIYIYVYVIARAGVKFEINFTSCRENGSEIAQGIAECNFAVLATTSGIYPKISLLLVCVYKRKL